MYWLLVKLAWVVQILWHHQIKMATQANASPGGFEQNFFKRNICTRLSNQACKIILALVNFCGPQTLMKLLSLYDESLQRTREKSKGLMKIAKTLVPILQKYFWQFLHFYVTIFKKFNLQCFFFHLSVTIIGGIVFLIFALTAFFIEE